MSSNERVLTIGGGEISCVSPTGKLQDRRFLQCFPKAQSLALYGKKLKSLGGGISAAVGLLKLVIETASTNKTELSECRSSNTKWLRVGGARTKDFSDINACLSIRGLEIVGGQLESLRQLAAMRLPTCMITHRRISALSGVDDVEELRSLWLSTCPALSEIKGAATQLERVVVESCGRFDMGTLRNATGLRSLRIIKCKRPFSLTDVSEPESLQELVITNSAVDLRSSLGLGRALRKLWLSPATEEVITSASVQNPGALVSNGNVTYFLSQEHWRRAYLDR